MKPPQHFKPLFSCLGLQEPSHCIELWELLLLFCFLFSSEQNSNSISSNSWSFIDSIEEACEQTYKPHLRVQLRGDVTNESSPISSWGHLSEQTGSPHCVVPSAFKGSFFPPFFSSTGIHHFLPPSIKGMNYAPSCTPSVQALNKLHPSLLEVFINCPSPPAPQLSLLQSGYSTTTNPTPCHIISYFLFSFLSRNLTTACSYDPCNPFPLGNSALLCCPSPLFTPGFPNVIKGLAGQAEFSSIFLWETKHLHLQACAKEQHPPLIMLLALYLTPPHLPKVNAIIIFFFN